MYLLHVLGKYSGLLNQIRDVIKLKSVIVDVLCAWSKYPDHEDCGHGSSMKQCSIILLPVLPLNMSASIRTFVNFAYPHIFPRLVMCFRLSNQIGYKWKPIYVHVDPTDIILDQSIYQ